MRSFVVFFLFLTHVNCLWSYSVPYKLVYEGNKVGLVDEGGNILIPAKYEDLGWTNAETTPKNKLIGFKQNGLWGILSLQNEIIVPNLYTKLYPADSKFFVASKQGKYSQRDFLGLITSTGKEVIPFRYSSIKVIGLRAIVGVYSGRNYSYGLVDLGGKPILSVQYKDIKPLGNLRFAVKDFSNTTAIFNDNGKAFSPFELDSISPFKNGYAVTYSNHLRGIIDVNGSILQTPQFKSVVLSEVPQLKKFPTWSVIEDAKVTKKYSCDYIEPLGQDRYRVQANERQWIINNQGVSVTSESNSLIYQDNNDYYIFKNATGWGVATSEYSLLYEPKYDSILPVNKNYFLLTEQSWMVYDCFGIKKSEQVYDKIKPNGSHYISVKKKEKWGLIDQSGREVVHCVYQELSNIQFNKLVVKFHDNYGVIDKMGDWVVLPQRDPITILTNDLYLIRAKNLTTLKSFEGETIYFTSNRVEMKDDYLLEYLSGGGLWKIDLEGRIVNRELPQQNFQEIRASSEGLFAVRINNRFGFVDNQNRLLVANRYENVGDFHEGLAAVKLLGKWGFIDKNENLIIQPQYSKVGVFHNGVVTIKQKSGMGLINKQGKKLSRFDYDDIYLQSNGKYLIKKDGKYGLLASDGSLLILAKYDYLEELTNGFVKVSLFGKYGVVSEKGVDFIPILYDELTFDHRYGHYLAMKNSDWENLSN